MIPFSLLPSDRIIRMLSSKMRRSIAIATAYLSISSTLLLGQQMPVLQAPGTQKPGTPVQNEAPGAIGRLPYTVRYTPQTGSIQQAVFVVEVGEYAINRLLQGVTISRSGPVTERIAGADVAGHQSMFGEMHADFKRDHNRWQIWLLLNGMNYSQTIGVAHETSVASTSRQQFQLAKPLIFDGHRVGTTHPKGSVQPQTVNHAAWTRIGGLPLLGPIANGIALQAADARRGKAERESGDLLLKRLKPEFNRSVDQLLAKANQFAADWETAFETGGTADLRLDSYERGARLTSFASDGHSPDRPKMPLAEQRRDQIRFQLHQSEAQRLIDALPLSGALIPDSLLETRLPLTNVLDLFQTLPSQWKDGLDLAPRKAHLRLADESPVRIIFADDRISLRILATVEPLLGDPLSLQEILLTWRLEREESGFRFIPLPVEISRVDDQRTGLTEQVIQSLVKQAFAERFSELVIPRSVHRTVDSTRSFDWEHTHIAFLDGWLQLICTPRESKSKNTATITDQFQPVVVPRVFGDAVSANPDSRNALPTEIRP